MKKLVMLRTKIKGKTETTILSEKHKEQLDEKQLKNFELEFEFNQWANKQAVLNYGNLINGSILR